tara:strand:- start:878 stop:1390 length:513 start_codon:yes stop_codon:yes gene_type:complete
MVAKTYIEPTLKALDERYREGLKNKEALLVSKMAIIELGGWTEETIDALVSRYAQRKIQHSPRLNKFNEAVRYTHGFQYQKHFTHLVKELVGCLGVELIERKADRLKIQRLESALSNLTDARNKAAHTHIQGATYTIDAPSVTLSNYNFIYDGLKEFEKYFNKTNLHINI